MEPIDKLTSRIDNLELAIANAKEQCEIAMEELEKIKIANEVDAHMISLMSLSEI